MAQHTVGESEHHESPEGTRWIWMVFWLLLVVTGIEVGLGIVKPGFLMGGENVIGTSYLNVLFILLTLVKAYYIVAFFMHLKFERMNMIWTISLPALILIPYLLFIILTEGSYINIMLP
jgi:cytochrome c oxidase subunit IV